MGCTGTILIKTHDLRFVLREVGGREVRILQQKFTHRNDPFGIVSNPVWRDVTVEEEV